MASPFPSRAPASRTRSPAASMLSGGGWVPPFPHPSFQPGGEGSTPIPPPTPLPTPMPVSMPVSMPMTVGPAAVPTAPAARSLDDLQRERSYLLQGLQAQDRRARELLERLSAAMDRVPLAQDPAAARKARKDVRAVKKKIAENTKQERSTLLRLSELYIEIQSRGRWYEIQQQKAAAMAAAAAAAAAAAVAPAGPPHPTPMFHPVFYAPNSASYGFFADQPALVVAPYYVRPAGSNPISPRTVDTPSNASCLSPLSPVFVPSSTFRGSAVSSGQADAKEADFEKGKAAEIAAAEPGPEGPDSEEWDRDPEEKVTDDPPYPYWQNTTTVPNHGYVSRPRRCSSQPCLRGLDS